MQPPLSIPKGLGEDSPAIAWAPSLTPRRLIVFVIAWLVLFAILSVFVSNPFLTQPTASARPDYARVMFLHGLLSGIIGLLALLACQVLALQATHVRIWIIGGAVVATILAAVGGIWDRTVPGSEVPMWTQVLGFFALDEILLMLVVGVVYEWRRQSPVARTLPFVITGVASASMLVAALIGHLAGWILEFGPNFPPLIGAYERWAGFAKNDDFIEALRGSHSHDLVVGMMAMALALAARQFGYDKLASAPRALARVGMGMIAAGTAIMTVMYGAMAFTIWKPPTMFVSGPEGANGIAGDDLLTGILIMGGGVLVAIGLALWRWGSIESLFRRPARLAAIWAWVLSFATVVIAGYYIELHETYFGAGDSKALGAAKDAIYTWLHQDTGLFLLPATVLLMLAVERLVADGLQSGIGRIGLVGTSVVFLGSVVYVFVNPALYGPGYFVTTLGLLILGAALLATLWGGLRNRS